MSASTGSRMLSRSFKPIALLARPENPRPQDRARRPAGAERSRTPARATAAAYVSFYTDWYIPEPADAALEPATRPGER